MAPQTTRPVARALLSVSDKTGLVELARGLAKHGVELVASGGTATALRDAGLTVVEVADLTQSPEMLGGRVKTLHPRIHGGLLARRDLASDQADMAQSGIRPIDLVVVNLYPFESTVAKPGVSLEDAIEHIDIGGPSMIRSAAKNHAYVAVLTDPADYAAVLAELDTNAGLGDETRRRLALKAFERTGTYDTAIHAWLAPRLAPSRLERVGSAPSGAERDHKDAVEPATDLPDRLHIDLPRAQLLRYGENPHQGAALYGGFLDAVESLHGKELSFNNVVDAQAALSLILDFDAADDCTLAILKHNTPCGVGTGATPLAAWQAAFSTDPDSPFGGIIVANRAFDLALARAVDEIFTEVLIAPDFAPDALDFLRKKKNRRLLRYRPERIDRTEPDVRHVFGGLLVQQPDLSHESVGTQVVTARKPTEDELRALAFGWKIVKHVKSNAVVFARADRTVAIGGGQTSRVDAVHVAAAKAARVGNALAGTVVASDAFFPFPDGLEAAIATGATACVQPGGSTRDAEVIAAADRLGIAMVFTGARHFRH